MAENKIYRFCPDGTVGTDLYSDDDYERHPNRGKGNYGISDRKLANKALRQASVVYQAIAQWLWESTGSKTDFDDSQSVNIVLEIIRNATHSESVEKGTRMFFVQPAAPSGWTRINDETTNDRMLHLVTKGGGGTGGKSSPVNFDVTPSHTHTFRTENNSSKHSHTVSAHSDIRASFAPPYSVMVANSSFNSQLFTSLNNDDHTHTMTTDHPTNTGVWTPRYLDVILCHT